jgi:hypothetical protein
MTAFPKPKRWKSKKYRDAARNQDCTIRLPGCQNDTETTVLAHRNGAGMGTKASDHDAADLCQYCHDIYDRRNKAGEHLGDRRFIEQKFNRARLETIINRIERGIIK